jgi:hypothetical protein
MFLAPTHFLKNNTGIIPGHIAIFHDINGPTYTSTTLSKKHLFEKAFLDLKFGLIDLAIVGFVNNYENEMTLAFHSNLASGKVLTEAVGVVLMTSDSFLNFTNKNDDENFYGFLDGMISVKDY